MLYLYNKKEGYIQNVGNAVHIQRTKSTYGNLNKMRWFWIVQTRHPGGITVTKYYPCSEYEFHMYC